MVEPVIDSDEVNKALRIIKSIKEIPNPEYKKAKRDRQAFSPQPGSIRQTDKAMQPSLAEQMATREKRHEIKTLAIIKDICEYCPECSDCSFSMEMQAIDRCLRVKRNLIYMGVVEP